MAKMGKNDNFKYITYRKDTENMKKITWIFLVAICLCICLSACDTDDPFEKKSLDNFSEEWSNYSTTDNIIPEGFINRFAYTDGYCYHFCFGKDFSFAVSDRALLFFEYDDETYNQAKEYVFANLILSSKPVEEYNGYIFYDNYSEQLFNEESSYAFPYAFMRFAYNDSKNTLIFIGCFTSHDFDENMKQTSADWGVFLEKYYGEWYDFSQ